MLFLITAGAAAAPAQSEWQLAWTLKRCYAHTFVPDDKLGYVEEALLK
jgi:hypothetical protein